MIKVSIALTILIGCVPIAIIVTLVTASFWLWIENSFQIEAYGHSGPAQWCYLVSYGVVVALFGAVWLSRTKENVK